MEGPLPAGAAFDDFLRETAPASRDRRLWKPDDGPMPALCLSHGAPPLFDDRGWVQVLPDPDEPVIHRYAEGRSPEESEALATEMRATIEEIMSPEESAVRT